jgi:maltose alpha-D-glucosyltransferase/alpha-amylase
MQWDSSPNAGFSGAAFKQLYAPVIDEGEYDYRKINVQQQENDPDSLLKWTRRALRVRSQHPALSRGSHTILPIDNPSILAYLRQYETETLVIINNLSSSRQQFKLSLLGLRQADLVELFHSEPQDQTLNQNGRFALEPYGFAWYQQLVSSKG